jgi:hypothetical protein
VRLGKHQIAILKMFHNGEMKKYDSLGLFDDDYDYDVKAATSRDEMRREVFGDPTNLNCATCSRALRGLLQHGLVEKAIGAWGDPDLFFMTIAGEEALIKKVDCR